MRLALLAGAVLTAVLGSQPAHAQPGQPPTVTSLLQGIAARYGQAKSYAADFDERRWVKAYSQETPASGQVTTSPGAAAQWTYATPLTPAPPPETFDFLGGMNRYNFTAYSGARIGFQGGDVLVGTPVNPSPTVSKLLVYVDGSFAVRRVMVIDGRGDRDRLDFRNEKLS